MNLKELKELEKLEIWIAKNVMGFLDVKMIWHDNFQSKVYQGIAPEGFSKIYRPIPKYTTDPAAAMEALKKCVEFPSSPEIQKRTFSTEEGWKEQYCVTNTDDDSFMVSETLELAICLFAKKLFTK